MKNYGGKANSLIKLKNNNFNVPSFFIISNEYYNKFLEENNIYDSINKLIKEKNYKEIENIIMKSTINNELLNYIYSEFQKLDSTYVSVRSSASNEDGENKSYAGQYNTFLNVSKEELIDKIKLCWSSLYTNNVISYDKKLNNEMNVIVQTMVEADYAGVAFSVDPTSNTLNYSVIEVVKGIGESLVSGNITPSKYLIRRETKHIDLKIDEVSIDESIIEKLEEIILEIEKLYNKFVDIEFAVKNDKIFILQARPITAISQITRPFSLAITRPNSLIEESIYYKGEYNGIKEITKNLYYFKPLFIYSSKNNNTEIYYNDLDLEENPILMYYYMDLYYEEVLEKYDLVKKYIKELNEIIDNKKNFNMADMLEKLVFIYPFSSLGQLAGHFDKITDRIKNILFDFRNNYDYIIHKTSDYINEVIKNSLSIELKDYEKFITLDEYLNNNIPTLEILEKRKNGYIYFNDEVITNNFNNWLKENNIRINNDEEYSSKGTIAYGKKDIIGNVCKIYSEDDFSKFKNGDILVTPMTTPKFISVIRKSKAIITDEGGITCHAAIISRELKIPCVVGCKNITKILNDGDKIKINMSTGEIIIN